MNDTRVRAAERRARAALFAVATVATLSLAFGRGADAQAPDAAPSSAPPVIARVEKRWTTKIVEYPGTIGRPEGGGPFVLTLETPGAMGVGDGVAVVFGDPAVEVTGHVETSVSPEKAGAPVRSTIKLPNDSRLADGMPGKLRLTTTDKKVLAVPTDAIRRTGKEAAVVKIDPKEKTETVSITTGVDLGGGWTEVRSGLAVGDRVVLP